MMQLAALMLAQGALTALCLAMPKHHAQVWRHEGSAPHRALLRVLGGFGLIATVALCIAADGVGIGLVMFCAVLTLAGSCVAWLLPYRARGVAALGALSAASAVFTALLGLVGR
jgi:Protein of unknown function (DUF3325)